MLNFLFDSFSIIGIKWMVELLWWVENLLSVGVDGFEVVGQLGKGGLISNVMVRFERQVEENSWSRII